MQAGAERFCHSECFETEPECENNTWIQTSGLIQRLRGLFVSDDVNRLTLLV